MERRGRGSGWPPKRLIGVAALINEPHACRRLRGSLQKPTVRHVLRPVLLFRHCKLEGRDAEPVVKSFPIESVLAKRP